MVKYSAFGVILLSACVSWGQPASTLLLKNVNIVALGGGADQAGREVLLENGKIASIRAASNKADPGLAQIDAAGKWLVPGLIDMHVRLAAAPQDSAAVRQECSELLALGVTSILDLSGAAIHAVRAAQNSHAAPGLGVFRAGVLLPGLVAQGQSSLASFFIKSEQEARQAVRSAQAQGMIVIYLDPRLDSRAMKAALQEAQALNMPAAGVALGFSFEAAARHGLGWLCDVNSLLSASLGGTERQKIAQAWAVAPAALYGAKSEKLFFEAWNKFDPVKEGRKKLGVLASRAVFVAPMLALEQKRLQEFAHTAHASGAQKVREKFQILLRSAFELQVPLLVASGYSANNDWRPDIHDEMAAWIEAGIAPRFVLEAATINAGHALRQHDLGQIGEGMRADLVLLDEHPYQNFATLRRPWLVVQNGHAYTRAELERRQDATSRAQREIRAVLSWQEQAWNDGDLERFMRGYWKSDSTVFASSSVSRGWQSMLERYQHGYPTPESMGTLTFTIAQIDLISGDWAKVLGAWELSGSGAGSAGWFTLLLRRFEEGWRIVHDHTSVTPVAP